MLRHCVEVHGETNPDEIEFGMQVISCHTSAFHRQLSEAVQIEMHSGPYLLNSKLEYSRCNLPKMMLKLGNDDEKTDPMKEKEKSTSEKIQMIYKGENKRMKSDDEKMEKKAKKKRVENDEDIVEIRSENLAHLTL